MNGYRESLGQHLGRAVKDARMPLAPLSTTHPEAAPVPTPLTWVTTHTHLLATVAVWVVAAALLAAGVWRVLRTRQAAARITRRGPGAARDPRQGKSTANRLYYAAAALGIAVSADTSYRFFGDKLGIVGPERIGLFSVVELSLLACAFGMRDNVRATGPDGRAGSPGTARVVAWVLCIAAGYAALVEAGPVEGLARIVFGPLLAMVMLHLALGIEIRNVGSHKDSTWKRIGAELRERALSRLGLSDDTRDALTRTRDRALARVARLAADPGWVPFRQARIARAVRISGVSGDPAAKRRLRDQLAVLKHAGALVGLELDSPWDSMAAAPAKPTPRKPAPPSAAEATVELPKVTAPADTAPASAPPDVPADPPVTETTPKHSKTGDLVSITREQGRPKWVTPDMTPTAAMIAYLERHGETAGVVLDRWAAELGLPEEFKPGLGRKTLSRWKANRDAERPTAVGEE